VQGPTRTTVGAVDASSTASLRAWIAAQTALPFTSHREYYRRRANARLLTAVATGGVRSACSAGSRWHRFALTKADEQGLLAVDVGADGYTLRVDGDLRTVASTFALSAPAAYRVCYVEERVGGTVTLATSTARNCNNALKVLNAPIEFATADLHVTHIIGAADGETADLAPLAHAHNASILEGRLACTRQFAALAHGFVRATDGSYYRHDPRVALLSNTMDMPANATAFASIDATPATRLPLVPKTFLNKHSCTPIELGMGATAVYSSATFTLNASMLRTLYTAANRSVAHQRSNAGPSHAVHTRRF
jgi:hypothetical protein